RAAGEETLVRVTGLAGVVHAYDADPREIQRLHERLELGVDEEEPGARMAEDVADLVGAEPRVDGDEDAAGGGDAVVRLEHRGDVRAEERDPVVLGEARQAQRRRQAIHPRLEFAVRVSTRSVDDGDLVGDAVRAARWAA